MFFFPKCPAIKDLPNSSFNYSFMTNEMLYFGKLTCFSRFCDDATFIKHKSITLSPHIIVLHQMSSVEETMPIIQTLSTLR